MIPIVQCVWVKRFYTNTFFCPAWDNFSSENILCHSLYSTKNWKTRRVNNRHPVNGILKFILGHRFIFKAYVKNVREKTTKCSLKTDEVLLDAVPKFDIYQSTVAPNCFKSHATPCTMEVWTSKKIYSGL